MCYFIILANYHTELAFPVNAELDSYAADTW